MYPGPQFVRLANMCADSPDRVVKRTVRTEMGPEVTTVHVPRIQTDSTASARLVWIVTNVQLAPDRSFHTDEYDNDWNQHDVHHYMCIQHWSGGYEVYHTLTNEKSGFVNHVKIIRPTDDMSVWDFFEAYVTNHGF